MLNVFFRNKNKFKQFIKKIKLIRMINVYVNKCVCYYRFIYNYNNIILYVIYEQYEI